MDSYIVWFVVAFGLLVAELLTGTFYLLVIAIALAAAGFAALAGASSPLQFIVGAAIGLGGSIWLRSTRFGERLHERGEDLVQNMSDAAVINRAERARTSGGAASLIAAAVASSPFLLRSRASRTAAYPWPDRWPA